MGKSKKEKLHCHFKWKKPNVNDISVQLGFNDKMCIKMSNAEYQCMLIKDWFEINPLAVLVENVVNKGPKVRKEVHHLFMQKINGINIHESRKKYLASKI